jgi:general secretion pathway protein M
MTRARAAALAILFLLLALAWIGPVAAYRDVLDGDVRRLAELDAALARDRALVTAAPETQGALPAAVLLPPETSDAQAAALLQETLKAAAAAARVEVVGLQVMPADSLAGSPRVGVRLGGRGAIDALNRLIYAIEESRPMLYPDNLRIEARDRDGALDFQLDISAFKPGAPS